MKGGLVRLVLVLSLFSILCMNAFAGNETIIKGWVKAETITIKEMNYTFVLNTEPKFVVMEFENTLLKVSATYCDVKNYMQLCVEDVQHNRTDPETKIRYYKAYVTVTKQTADVTATQTIDKKEGTIEDSFDLTTTIENTGVREATNVLFMQKFPEGLSISSYVTPIDSRHSDCKIDTETNTVYWNGTLLGGQKLSCPYPIIPKEAGKFSITGNISYNTGTDVRTDILGALDLDIAQGSLEVYKSLSSDTVEIGETVLLNASVKNVFAEQNQSVTFTIDVPTALKITNKSYELDREENNLEWRGDIAKGSSVSFSATLFAQASGNLGIPIKVSYILPGGRDKAYTALANITVSAKSLSIITDAPTAVETGEVFNVSVALKSNTDRYYYHGIDVSVASDIPGFRAIRKSLDTKLVNFSGLPVFDDIVQAPDVAENTTFNVTVVLKYQTEFGQDLREERRYRIFVEAPIVEPEEKFFNVPLENLKDSKEANLSTISNKVEEILHVDEITILLKESLSKPINIILIVGTLIAVTLSVFMYQRMKKEPESP